MRKYVKTVDKCQYVALTLRDFKTEQKNIQQLLVILYLFWFYSLIVSLKNIFYYLIIRDQRLQKYWSENLFIFWLSALQLWFLKKTQL